MVFCCQLVNFVVLTIITYVMFSDWFLTTDINRGTFGWVHWDTHRLGVSLGLTLVVDWVGSVGYAKVLKDFDPVLIGIVNLLEPVLGEMWGVLAGFDDLPGTWTVVGGLVILSSVVIITLGEQADSSNKANAGGMGLTPKVNQLINMDTENDNSDYPAAALSDIQSQGNSSLNFSPDLDRSHDLP